MAVCPECDLHHYWESCPVCLDECPVCGGDHRHRECPDRRERAVAAADVAGADAAVELDPTVDTR